MKESRITLLIIISVVGIWLLYLLADLLIPLVLALFLVMVYQPVFNYLHRFKIPNWISISIVSILTLLVLTVFISIVAQTASQVAAQSSDLWNRLLAKIDIVLLWINTQFKANIDSQQLLQLITQTFPQDRITGFLGSFAKFLGSFTSSFFMFAIYFIILLAGFNSYQNFILYVGGKEDGQRLLTTFESVLASISDYMAIKFVNSLITGIVFWIVCLAFRIPFALFWGFFAFVLNYIPTIGAIFSTAPPILMALIYLNSFGAIILFSVLLITGQFVLGSILEPMMMGNKLKINTLTVILGLVLWGKLWGIPGMLLSVPMLVLIKVILIQIPETRIFARAMGSTSEFNSKNVVDEVGTQETVNMDE